MISRYETELDGGRNETELDGGRNEFRKIDRTCIFIATMLLSVSVNATKEPNTTLVFSSDITFKLFALSEL